MAQVRSEHARKRLGFRAPKAVAAAGIAAVAVLGTVGSLRLQAPDFAIASSDTSQDAPLAGDADPVADGGAVGEPLLLPEYVVHVDGAVQHPGVYTLNGETPRACDAVDAAGGLADDADTSSINLAQPVSDGSKIHIPTFDEAKQAQAAASDSSAGLVNINTADAQALMQLPGVGEQTAAAIIEDRERFGAFSSVDELLRVSGIGEKKLEKIRPHACV